MWNKKLDHYKLQRLALLPAIENIASKELFTALKNLSISEQQQLLALIIEQGLQFFWLQGIQKISCLPTTLPFQKILKDRCFQDTTRYLAQKKILASLDRLFALEQIPYAVIKGAHIREIIYPSPAYRPARDIDLLVSPNRKATAIRVLCENGYTLQPNLTNISHEIGFVKDHVHIDLHWHIMRPGRTRIDLTECFLQSRQRENWFWGLDNNATLFVMLVHPVFTKYSTAPQSSIVRLVDLRTWIITKEIDWQRLLDLLDISGMKTAAWITAHILENLTKCHLPNFVQMHIAPKNPRRFLLQKWLSLNISTKLAQYPIFSKYIFTLLAHDTLDDVVTFIRRFRKEIENADNVFQELR